MSRIIKRNCAICKKEFGTSKYRPAKTCSRKCMGISLRGVNNPNYGNTWSEEQKRKLSVHQKSISEEISARVKNDWKGNLERKNKAARTMRKTMSQRIGKLNHWYGKQHTKETKKKIGEKSKAKFTKEFNENIRKIMEERGHWIPLEEKDDFEIYFKESQWAERMFDLIENGIELLNEHGIFCAGKNNNGAVRDHIMGRKFGFKYKIFPEIIRHPCNCQIIRHSENVSKGQKGKGRPDSDITIEELFQKIEAYQGDWFEQKRVLQLIEDYRNGKRWTRKREVRSDVT